MAQMLGIRRYTVEMVYFFHEIAYVYYEIVYFCRETAHLPCEIL